MIKYSIVPKDNNCVCMCFHRDYGFIRIDKANLEEAVGLGITYLSFDDRKIAQGYIDDNFLHPELYIVQSYYKNVDDTELKENNCKNCYRYSECKNFNTSFEFAEYGDKWAEHCERYDPKEE